MLEHVQLSELQARLWLGAIEYQNKPRVTGLTLSQALLKELHQHGGEVDEVNQQPLLASQVCEVLLQQREGEIEEMVQVVRDDQVYRLAVCPHDMRGGDGDHQLLPLVPLPTPHHHTQGVTKQDRTRGSTRGQGKTACSVLTRSICYSGQVGGVGDGLVLSVVVEWGATYGEWGSGRAECCCQGGWGNCASQQMVGWD